MNAFWSWMARYLSPFLKPLLLELLAQEQAKEKEKTAYVLREQLQQEIAPVVHELIHSQIRVWGSRDRLHLAPTAAMVNTLFNTASGQITVGDYSFAGHNVSILTGSHDVSQRGKARMESYPSEGRDIVIGNGVWIGSNATVLGPCTIGNDAVVAAGAVVIAGTVVPAGAIVAGVPARVVKTIEFDAD